MIEGWGPAPIVNVFVFSTMSLSPPGPSELFGSQRTVFKLKRFLGTLIKFGTDISAQVGEKVREMVFNLVVSFFIF